MLLQFRCASAHQVCMGARSGIPACQKNSQILAGAVGDEAEVFAEAKGGDTLLEGGAAAGEQALEKGFETEGAGDVVFDLGEIVGGRSFPIDSDLCLVAQAAAQ